MDTDSIPEVESILIKCEDNSCPLSPESGQDQVDPFFEEAGSVSIDIKHEYPPYPKKKRRGSPSSKKKEPVPATSASSKPSMMDKKKVKNVDPEADFGDEENPNIPTPQNSTEGTEAIAPLSSTSFAAYKSLELEMHEIIHQRDALQVKLKASEEKANRKIFELESTVASLLAKNQSYKDLEIEIIKLSVEREKFEESQKKSGEELNKMVSELEMYAANFALKKKELEQRMDEVTLERDGLKEKLEEMNEKVCKLEEAAIEDLAEKKIAVKKIGLEPDLEQADLDLEQKMKTSLATIAEKVKVEKKNEKKVGNDGKSEDASSIQPRKKKRKRGNVSNAPDSSTQTRSHSMATRSRTVNARVNADLPTKRSTRARKIL